MWNLALDGITSFSTLPLRVWTYGGLLVAFAYMMVIIGRTLLFGSNVPGYPSLMAILLFFSSVNMIGLGIMGAYLGRVFVEVKRRPLYLVRQVIGFAGPDEVSPFERRQEPELRRFDSARRERLVPGRPERRLRACCSAQRARPAPAIASCVPPGPMIFGPRPAWEVAGIKVCRGDGWGVG